MNNATAPKQKIVPHLWFDNNAQQAGKLYASLFPESSSKLLTTLRNTPSGDCDVVSFELWGHSFMGINGGPLFKFNPATSFIVNFDPLFFDSSQEAARKELDRVWNALADGGNVLMPIDKYFFSERYGWLQDKYGVPWQLILTDPKRGARPPLLTSLMFAEKNAGQAEQAIKFYLSVFRNSEMGVAHRYGKDMAPNKEGTLMFSDFMLEGAWFAAMDSAVARDTAFNEATSLIVHCDTQDEVDYYWKKLSAVPESEQCGWLKDKYGLSWQITPRAMHEMMTQGTPKQIARLVETFLPMKKLDLDKLTKAYRGK